MYGLLRQRGCALVSSFYLYNAQHERIGILEHEESVQWLEQYQGTGEVKIVARATQANIEKLVEGNRVTNTDSDTIALIVHKDIVSSVDGKSITARALPTIALLEERVLMGTEQIANAEAGIYSLYTRNRRGLPIETRTPVGYPDTAPMEVSWGSALAAVQSIATISKLGFKVVYSPESALETLVVYKGTDRTIEGSEAYAGYFGTDVENIRNVTVSSGMNSFKNVAIVAGAGEGAARVVRIVSLGNPTAENRRELFVDARDLQKEYQVATSTGDVDANGNPVYSYETRLYTEAEYNAILDARGREKLAEHLRDFSITCDVDQHSIQYGVDYGLGDRMPLRLHEYGINAKATIIATTWVYERGGRKLVAVLGDFELGT